MGLNRHLVPFRYILHHTWRKRIFDWFWRRRSPSSLIRSLDTFFHRETREEASTALVQTLSEFSVRGQIHCNVKYLMTLLEKDDFRANVHDTAWLGRLDRDRGPSTRLPDHVVIACGAVLKASAESKKLEEQVAQCLRRGVPGALDGKLERTLFRAHIQRY